MKPNPILQDDTVLLRHITSDDTPSIVRWRNNPNVRRNFVFQDIFTEEMHMNFFRTKVLTGEVVQYIIIQKSTSCPVGSVYLRDIDRSNRSAEYGMFIGEDSARNHGLGTRSAILLTDYGLHNLHLHRISVRIFADNIPSIVSCRNAGFRLEGIARDAILQDGSFRDMVFMAKLEKVEAWA